MNVFSVLDDYTSTCTNNALGMLLKNKNCLFFKQLEKNIYNILLLLLVSKIIYDAFAFIFNLYFIYIRTVGDLKKNKTLLN